MNSDHPAWGDQTGTLVANIHRRGVLRDRLMDGADDRLWPLAAVTLNRVSTAAIEGAADQYTVLDSGWRRTIRCAPVSA
jgi:hypothetical protein